MAKRKNIFDANFDEVSKQITKENFSSVVDSTVEAERLEAESTKTKIKDGRPKATHTRKKYTLMVEPILMKQLKQKAFDTEKNVSDILEVLIKDYLNQ